MPEVPVLAADGVEIVGDKKSRLSWSADMDDALVTQVIEAGVKAFVTSEANTASMKPEEKWDREAVSASDGGSMPKALLMM